MNIKIACHYIALLLLGVNVHYACAQDTIVMVTGSEVRAKVLEVSPGSIKYKKFDNLNGPSYTASHSDIFMIKYENGSRDVFGIATSTEAKRDNPGALPAPSNIAANNPLDKLNSDMVYVEGNSEIRSFYISRYEVTQELYTYVMHYNPSNNQGSTLHPVEMVTPDDVREFIRRLNQMTGKNYRLPTDEEWPYACKGGKKSKGYKYSGSDIELRVGWVEENSDNTTHEVGMKDPNELGIYGMSGNVSEFVIKRDKDKIGMTGTSVSYSSGMMRTVHFMAVKNDLGLDTCGFRLARD